MPEQKKITGADLKVRHVGKDVLFDYKGSNPAAARIMGGPAMADDEMLILEGQKPADEAETIKHERQEYDDITAGAAYWPAHVKLMQEEESKAMKYKDARVMAVKFADDGGEEAGIIEGIFAPYGGPLKGKDLQGEYFSQRTDFCDGWFKSRPILFHHGMDDSIKAVVIGHDIAYKALDNGRWLRAQLDKSMTYWNELAQLIKQGKVFFSSGAVPHLVEKAVDGELLRWPWVETSLTVSPANPLAVINSFKAIDDLKAIGATDAELAVIRPPAETAYEFAMKAATKPETDVTENEIRIRVKDPGAFDKDSFRYIDIDKDKGIQAVSACPKGEYENGKCKVGTQVQSYRFDKENWTATTARAWVDKHEKKEAKDMETKAMSDNDKRDALNAAVCDKWGRAADAVSPKSGAYVRDVFPTELVFDVGGKLFQTPYTMDEKGVCSFGEPIEVTQRTVYTAKATNTIKATCPQCKAAVAFTIPEPAGTPAPVAPDAGPPKPAGDTQPPATNPGVGQGMGAETHVASAGVETEGQSGQHAGSTPAPEKPRGDTTPPAGKDAAAPAGKGETPKPVAANVEKEPEPPPAPTKPMDNTVSAAAAPPAKADKAAEPVKDKPQADATEGIKAVITEALKSVKDTVTEALKPLDDRIKSLENAPADSGPIRRVANPANPTPEENAAESKRLKAMMDDPATPPEVKRYLGEQFAADDVKDILAKGPVPLRKRQ